LLEIFVPKTSVIFLNVISIFLSSFWLWSYVHIPSITVPFAYFSNKWQALFIAIYVLFESKPFSNLLLASLLNIFFAVFLTLTPSNIADSIIIFFVCGTTSVSSPPITPANPIDFSLVEITMSFSSNVLSILSNVVSFSPFFAILTIISLFSLSAS